MKISPTLVRGGLAAAFVAAAVMTVPGNVEHVAQAFEPSPLDKLVDDAAQRLKTADPVAAFKYRTGGAVDDPVREQHVIDSVVATANAAHVDSSFVRAVFRDQIDATDSLEHSRFAQWKIDPSSAPTDAPDLASSREVIDSLNSAIVDEIAQQWPILHGSTCRTDLEDAKAAAITKEGLDDLYQRALSYAVHRYCG